MFYTSYFAKLKKIPDNIIPISICAKTPSWFSGKEYKALAPSYNILMDYKKDGDKELYVNRFNNGILKELNQDTVVNDLLGIAGENKDICLMCYEKSEDFCHRHLIAEWLAKAGYECCEIDL